jgi:hypothetical protein
VDRVLSWGEKRVCRRSSGHERMSVHLELRVEVRGEWKLSVSTCLTAQTCLHGIWYPFFIIVVHMFFATLPVCSTAAANQRLLQPY